jgi:hypothetical protein
MSEQLGPTLAGRDRGAPTSAPADFSQRARQGAPQGDPRRVLALRLRRLPLTQPPELTRDLDSYFSYSQGVAVARPTAIARLHKSCLDELARRVVLPVGHAAELHRVKIAAVECLSPHPGGAPHPGLAEARTGRQLMIKRRDAAASRGKRRESC